MIVRVVAICGVLNVLALGALALGSTWLNLLKPLSVVDGRVPFYRRLAADFPILGAALPADLPPHPQLFLAGYLAPVLVSTALAVGLLVLLHRHREELPESLPRLLLGFAAGFALVSALGLPILADDFFVSLAWGRMVRGGVNPYYLPMEAVYAIGTPLEDTLWPHRMSYGPLWAALCAAVTSAAGGATLASAALLKALIAAAWIGCLGLVRAILADRSRWQQCVGLLLFGWLPLGPTQIVGDGRNEAFMALGILLWVHQRDRGRPVPAALALAASVAVKYVTAPLFLVDLVHHLRQRGEPLRSYLLPAFAALAVLLATFAPFHFGQDVAGYVGGSELMRIHVLTLREAVMALELWAGIGLGPLPELVRLVFPAVGVVLLWRYAREPDRSRFHLAALAVMGAVLFGLGGLVFPWYLAWLLALAALQPAALLARWTLALVLLGPAVFMPLSAFPDLPVFVRVYVTPLVWYLGALAVTPLLRRPLGHGAGA